MNSAIIEVTNLTKRYGSQIIAVDKLNLTIQKKGKCMAF